MNCRHCGEAVALTFVDLGAAPASNAYLTADRLQELFEGVLDRSQVRVQASARQE